MKCFNYHCQGESHKAVDKVCQDYSFSHINDSDVAIAVLSDGHGGNRYFRSDIGAKYAVEITAHNVMEFVKNIDETLLVGQHYVPNNAVQTEIDQNDFQKEKPIDLAFRQLFGSIIGQWQIKIEEHASSNPLSEKEKKQVEEKYQNEFLAGNCIEKTYGCTLMAYVSTSKYWFAFHIGDGKCISFDENAQWKEPIPWDNRCFLNKTTSLCDSDALNEFRYCYQGDGEFPIAVFLGSDGMDDSFGEESNLVNFYVQVVKSLVNDGYDNTVADICETLPILSKRGSQDDMSISCVYDENGISVALQKFILWQISITKAKILSINNKILDAKEKRSNLETIWTKSNKEKIELRYAQSDIDRGYAEKQQLVNKMNILLKECYGDSYSPYVDEVGVSEKQRILKWMCSDHPFRVYLAWVDATEN